MTSIDLQFMLFPKPLSVHSRSILWRPAEGEKRKGEGGGGGGERRDGGKKEEGDKQIKCRG